MAQPALPIVERKYDNPCFPRLAVHGEEAPGRFLSLLACVLFLGLSTATTAAEPAGWFPFVLPWNDAAPGVTDLSGWNEKPAGKSGFVRAVGPHLYAGQPGEGAAKPLRLFGVNFSFGANFPAAAEADQIAARLAKFGVNCVRFHHMDRDAEQAGIWQNDLRTISPAQLDRLDYFIAKLKEHGIYSDLNLHVSRYFPGHARETEGGPRMHKGVDLFMPDMIAGLKTFARELLLHVNPYTGNRYVDEPAIAIVELNNEDGIISRWWSGGLDVLPPEMETELTRRWRLYRDTHGYAGEVAALKKRNFPEVTETEKRRWMEFLFALEGAYWADMRAYLQDELGVKSLLVGTQLGAFSVAPLQTDFDALDYHAYWQHPEWKTKDRSVWSIGNKSLVDDPTGGPIAEAATYRVAGRPFLLTEYNHPTPNTFGGEAFPLVGAYGALQDWAGIFVYSYSHFRAGTWDSKRVINMFDIDQHPVKMVTLPIAAALFRRGDVSVPAGSRVVPIDPARYGDYLLQVGTRVSGAHFGLSRTDALRQPVGIELAAGGAGFQPREAPAGKGAVSSADGSLLWDTRGKGGVVTINTAATRAVIGFGGGGSFDLGGLTLTPSSERRGWSAIALSSHSGGKLEESDRVLLVAVGNMQNSGWQWTDESHSSLSSWGGPPTLVEGITCDFRWNGVEGVEVWALDERGQRRTPVPVISADRSASFEISPRYRTLWYEVVMKPGREKGSK